MSITIPLPADPQARKFVGPGGKLPAGTPTADANYEATNVVLVKADGETPLVVASNADAVSNTQDQVPTSARLQTFNGTTWDRARGDTANGLDVDVTRVAGSVAVTGTFWQATQPVSLASVPSHAVTNAGTFAVQETGAVASSTDVSLASSASSAQLLAANANRKGLLLTNTDANAVYLYYGTTATATKFTVKIPADGYWEMPRPIYTGRIDVVWSADGSGSLIGSEL